MQMCVCVCVCVCERERERERVRVRHVETLLIRLNYVFIHKIPTTFLIKPFSSY